MSPYRFQLATPDDDAALRHVARETPTPGWISFSLCCEPSFEGAAVVHGDFHQALTAREVGSGRIVGCALRSVREVLVNGQPRPVGYLGRLRLLPEHRSRGLAARGFRFLSELHRDGRAECYLTTIGDDNEPALDTLLGSRAGLPEYRFAGRLHTAALAGAPRPTRMPPDVTILPAERDDLDALVAFLAAHGPRRQFFPVYRRDDFFGTECAFRDLEPEDLLVARRAGRIVGTLGAWRQIGFQQTVVHGYDPRVRWARPLINCWARLTGLPRLPAAGTALSARLAAIPVVEDDDPRVFEALLHAQRLRCHERDEIFLLGLHEADPLLPVVTRRRATWYTTRLFLVWFDEPSFALDERPPYLELGTL
ncbi:MAG: GNAT family N-acetyltransferase [Planctomycetota bacterium]